MKVKETQMIERPHSVVVEKRDTSYVMDAVGQGKG